MRKTSRWIIALALMAGSCGSGTKSALELCRDAALGYCEKVFSCAEGEPRRATEGGTKDACITKTQTTCPADPCSASETYHADKAEQCVAAWQTVTCAQFGANSNLPICDEICTP